MTDDIMLNFTDDELAELLDERTTQVVESAPVVIRERVTVRSAEVGKAYLMKQPADWSWEDVRDYVVTMITRIHGPFPRNEKAEYGTFKGFHSRHAHLAGPIAKFAFESMDGIWRGAPVRVERFTAGNRKYFADPIIERLAAS